MSTFVDNKMAEYQPIRWTMVALFWANTLLELVATADMGVRFNILPVFITFWIARAIMRGGLFDKIKNNGTFNKILNTVGVFLGVYIAKVIVAVAILSAIA